MAIKKIPCGGWLYDDESITFEDGVMKVIGGGSGGGMVVHFEIDENWNVTSDKTVTEVEEALKTMPVSGYYEVGGTVGAALTIGYYATYDDTTGDIIYQLMFGGNMLKDGKTVFEPAILANNNVWTPLVL